VRLDAAARIAVVSGAVGSLPIYLQRVLRPPRTTGAFVFVAVPAACCVLIAIAVPLAAFLSRRRSPPAPGA
jgi:hypothetical protein